MVSLYGNCCTTNQRRRPENKTTVHRDLSQSEKPGIYIFKVTLESLELGLVTCTLRVYGNNAAEAQQDLLTNPSVKDFKLTGFIEGEEQDADDWWKNGGVPPSFNPQDIADNLDEDGNFAG